MWFWLKQWLSPSVFYQRSGVLLKMLLPTAIAGLFAGLWMGLFQVPADYQQGDAFRVMYVHVPAATLSLTLYAALAWFSGVYLVWRIKLADMLANSIAPVGASFTLMALITGAIWGKPMWGTWWIWDARLTSELVLFFLFFGYIALRKSITDQKSAAKAGAILALIGVIDLPIIHFSVKWWNTLHQPNSLSLFGDKHIAPVMLAPLYVALASFALFAASVVLMRVRNHITRVQHDTAR